MKLKIVMIGLIMCLFLIAPVSAGSLKPNDLDGDGLYEDLNGNGILDFDDVVRLYDGLDYLNSDKFDFNVDGVLDFEDVIALYDEL